MAPAGWWVWVVTPEQEVLKWGKDSDTEFPYGSEEEAVAEARWQLDQARRMPDDDEGFAQQNRVYIARVFPNGQIKHMEFVG